MTETKETAVCRGCGKELVGKPYRFGGGAYMPKTMERVPVNFYGGYVCSRSCDFNASLELERTMPGHLGSKQSISQPAMQQLNKNW